MRITKTQFSAYRDAIAKARATTLQQGQVYDGLGVWRSVKDSFPADASEQAWHPSVQSTERVAFYHQVLKELVDTDADGKTIEHHHFLLQCVRLPMREAPSPRKIMQLALNIGQLQAEMATLTTQDATFRSLYDAFQAFDMTEFDAYVTEKQPA
ncbi:hypothetical protein Poli38472_013273 [Pythium oligandrum]|uniref:Uncharacterized protein n=1 Tax=Pythium oligandrum TaxID=41045 RepID=A0A8K1FDB0_PYTOL|nr:hypothetical protein Poli38472_013273 [Pythium oligandrum]|eukprot:TMW55382.1 hypothetical protein Poli38472_013273 [Pythium oligandrum]